MIRSILIVDDDRGIRKLMSRVLTRAGYLVTEAEDGAVALEQLEAQRFDVIVLDLMMPRMNGFEVLDFMREHRNGRKCVVVASAASEQTIASVDESLVVTTLRKPFDIDALLAAVDQCISG